MTSHVLSLFLATLSSISYKYSGDLNTHVYYSNGEPQLRLRMVWTSLDHYLVPGYPCSQLPDKPKLVRYARKLDLIV